MKSSYRVLFIVAILCGIVFSMGLLSPSKSPPHGSDSSARRLYAPPTDEDSVSDSSTPPAAVPASLVINTDNAPSSSSPSPAPPPAPSASGSASLDERIRQKLNQLQRFYENDFDIPVNASLQETEDTVLGWLQDPKWSTENLKSIDLEERLTKIPIGLALRQFARSSQADLFYGAKEVNCSIAMLATRNCDPWRETFVQCLTKIGKPMWERILSPRRCIDTPFWQEDAMKYFVNNKKSSVNEKKQQQFPLDKLLVNVGRVTDSNYFDPNVSIDEQNPYIPPEKRHITPFIKSERNIRKNPRCTCVPFGFAHHNSLFESRVSRMKVFDFFPISPQNSPAPSAKEAKINDEDFYHQLYTLSYFGFAHRRGGSDQMRIYDSIAGGCAIIYFDLERVRGNTLAHLPKDLLDEIRRMPGVDHIIGNPGKFTRPGPFGVNFIRTGYIERGKFNVTRYYELTDKLHEYGKKYLTSRAVSAYMLKILGAENAKSVLVYSRHDSWYSGDNSELTFTPGMNDLGLNVTVLSTSDRKLGGTRTPLEFNNKLLLQKPRVATWEEVLAENGEVNMEGDEAKTFLQKMRELGIRPPENRRARDDFLWTLPKVIYGSGFGYMTKNTPRVRYVRPYDAIAADVADGKFDVVLVMIDGTNWVSNIVNRVPADKTKIGFVQFRDAHKDPDPTTTKACNTGRGPVFIREMY